MKLLVLDNYDSFTYNLVFQVRQLGFGDSMSIIRNDKINIEEVKEYDKILLSPGPGVPADAGIMEDLVKEYGPTKSILGICLGHQGIAEVFSADIYNMAVTLHGVTTIVDIEAVDVILFAGLPSSITVGLYHSWAVVPETVNGDLSITARNQEGIVMGVSHQRFDVRGLQFHPESILTPEGEVIIKNWLTS